MNEHNKTIKLKGRSANVNTNRRENNYKRIETYIIKYWRQINKVPNTTTEERANIEQQQTHG